ncbi:hypothetical protein SAMN00768000_1564 [Sulfobacillus thermosulfidooxidans DSM 9293]|uniref:Uncharacterized protein n=1 Tax=Sulfobacillus thermosulfidooxidans (strain DSM 9293 / VKM B-1269 / AT-1) TaxID=929705 RepID=A0A1W1WD91_SULTA|nr:hypothetical protein [Sulfobacillus thermosulfidooxidans]SMC04288.1 hypothetical protein SAMN00768000_1564 [Sulfobacillus thermosulfidooxidans DSM 9293]
MDKKRNGLTKNLLWISETTGLSAQAAIHALALEKEAEEQAESHKRHDDDETQDEVQDVKQQREHPEMDMNDESDPT